MQLFEFLSVANSKTLLLLLSERVASVSATNGSITSFLFDGATS